MKLLSSAEYLKEKNIQFQSMPFCLQNDYLKLYPKIEIVKYKNLYAPIIRQTIKKFKTIQFHFSPVNASGERANTKEESEFCEEFINYIQKNKIAHRIVQPVTHCLFTGYPSDSIKVPFGSYRIDLSKTENELLKNMQARYRTSINQTSGLQVEIKFGIAELEKFQNLHEETMKRTVNFFESFSTLKSELENLPENALLATIYIDGVLQGGLYLLYSEYCAFYMHGASSKNTSAQGAIRYLHYRMVCEMKNKGVKYYDFVGARLSDVSGTKYEGIQDFKRRFGSELIKGYLWKKDINPKIASSYDLLLKIKCKLNRTSFPKDIIDQEKIKFKSDSI